MADDLLQARPPALLDGEAERPGGPHEQSDQAGGDRRAEQQHDHLEPGGEHSPE